jgi:hypothetical protein
MHNCLLVAVLILAVLSPDLMSLHFSLDYRENELNFFNTHPVFRNLNPELFGVDQLSKKLTTVLVTKIKQELVRCDFSIFCCFRLLSGASIFAVYANLFITARCICRGWLFCPVCSFFMNDVPIDATVVPSRLTPHASHSPAVFLRRFR